MARRRSRATRGGAGERIRRLGRSRCGVPGVTTCRTRWRPSPSAASWASPFDRIAGGARRVPGRRAPVPGAGRGRRRDGGRRLRPSPDGDRGRARAARAGVGPRGSSWCSSRTATRGRRQLRGAVRPGARRGRRRRPDRHLRRRARTRFRASRSRISPAAIGRTVGAPVHVVQRARRRRAGGRERWRARGDVDRDAGRRVDRRGRRRAARGAGGRARPPGARRPRLPAASGIGMTVTAPADRRFLRARVEPGRRQGAWHAPAACRARGGGRRRSSSLRRTRWCGSSRTSGMFRVDPRRACVGTTRLSAGRGARACRRAQGREPALDEPPTSGAGGCSESPWVAGRDAAARLLPRTIEVPIVERRPIGIGRVGGALYLVDERGPVIDEFGPRYADFDLPIIDGLAGTAAGGTREADTAARGAGRAPAGRAAIASRIWRGACRRSTCRIRATPWSCSTTDRRCSGSATSSSSSGCGSTIEIAPALRERVPDMDYVDLRFGERVPVGRRRRGLAREQPPAGGCPAAVQRRRATRAARVPNRAQAYDAQSEGAWHARAVSRRARCRHLEGDRHRRRGAGRRQR